MPWDIIWLGLVKWHIINLKKDLSRKCILVISVLYNNFPQMNKRSSKGKFFFILNVNQLGSKSLLIPPSTEMTSQIDRDEPEGMYHSISGPCQSYDEKNGGAPIYESIEHPTMSFPIQNTGTSYFFLLPNTRLVLSIIWSRKITRHQ